MNAVVTTQAAPVATLPVVAEKESAFALAQRKAKAFASSSLVPTQYRDNVPNVLIAMEIAQRIGANELMVMQSLYIVQGKPSWSSQFLIATVNASGRFTPLRFEVKGEDPAKDDYRVRAYATDKESGERCEGPWITWAMVKAEGWFNKNGSKWKTMPELMFIYRAAGFWTRIYCPEISMGILTREEVEDVWGNAAAAHAEVQAPVNTAGSVEALKATLLEHEPLSESEQAIVQEEPQVTAQGVHDALAAAKDRDALDAAADLIRMLPEGEQAALGELYEQRQGEFAE